MNDTWETLKERFTGENRLADLINLRTEINRIYKTCENVLKDIYPGLEPRKLHKICRQLHSDMIYARFLMSLYTAEWDDKPVPNLKEDYNILLAYFRVGYGPTLGFVKLKYDVWGGDWIQIYLEHKDTGVPAMELYLARVNRVIPEPLSFSF
jgi:hypothetical protein